MNTTITTSQTYESTKNIISDTLIRYQQLFEEFIRENPENRSMDRYIHQLEEFIDQNSKEMKGDIVLLFIMHKGYLELFKKIVDANLFELDVVNFSVQRKFLLQLCKTAAKYGHLHILEWM